MVAAFIFTSQRPRLSENHSLSKRTSTQTFVYTPPCRASVAGDGHRHRGLSLVLFIGALALEPVGEVDLAAGGGEQAEDALVHVHRYAAHVPLRLQHLLFAIGVVTMVLEALRQLHGGCVLAVAALLV
jgi:hypothetical protein